MTDHALKNVGNIIKLRDEIDQKNRITNHIRSHLAVTDIIPTDFYINLKNMNTGFWAISYDPIPAIEDFVRICKNYDLTDYSGVRLWLTDDSVSVDNIQNNYMDNVIESAFDSLSGAQNIIGTVRQFGQSLGSPGTNLLNSMEQVANTASSSLSDLASSVISDVNLRNQVSSAMATLGKTAAGVIFHGKKVSLPKIWRSTSYSPALHLSIKLVSPYGDPKAIKHYIIEPLLYVLILSLPRTNDGVSYGVPRPIWVNGYGSTSLNLGYIESVQIRRGGRETSYNIYKQPLTLDISVTIKPLVDGIAVADGIKDFTKWYDDLHQVE